MTRPLDIRVYFDYVCPWCYVASVRLLKLKEAYGDTITIHWKSYPLDLCGCKPKFPVDIVNRNRRRAKQEEVGLDLELWPANRGMPATSIPAHRAAKCAWIQGITAFQRYHLLLLKSYFAHCRDISDQRLLVSLAEQSGLDIPRFLSDLNSGWPEEKVRAEYQEAAGGLNVVGVPTVTIGNFAFLEAAVPLSLYKRMVEKLRNEEK